jgi:long-chain fatty acid transport protein
MRRTFALGLAGLGFAAIVTASPSANASGYLTARFGSDQGTPSQPNTFAVYFNPAALGGTTGTTITADASLVLRFASYERPTSALSPSNPSRLNDPDYVKANTGKATLFNVLALPFLGINTDFGTKNLRAGYAFYVPFGGMANWDRLDQNANPNAPGASDGPQRWHNISGQLLSFYNTLALAYKIGPLSLGASVSGIIHTVSTVRARNINGDDDTVGGGKLAEGRSLITASGFNIGAAFGAYFEPEDKDYRIGLSYTTQPGFGETKMSGELEQTLASGPKGQVTKVNFLQSYPDIIRLGAAKKLGSKWEIRTDFEYVRWSVFDKQCLVAEGKSCDLSVAPPSAGGEAGRPGYNPTGDVILNVPRNWNDSIGMRLAPAFFLNENIELFASVGFTTPAVPKATIDASTIDSLRFYGTLGGKFNLGKHVGLGASYNHIAFMNVDTAGQSGQQGYAQQSRSPSAEGKYKSQIAMFNVNVSYTF